MSAELITQDAIAHIERLDIKNGDVLVARMKERYTGATLHALSKYLQAWLAERGLPNVQVFVMDTDTEISVLPPEQMREHGWVRASEGTPSSI